MLPADLLHFPKFGSGSSSSPDSDHAPRSQHLLPGPPGFFCLQNLSLSCGIQDTHPVPRGGDLTHRPQTQPGTRCPPWTSLRCLRLDRAKPKSLPLPNVFATCLFQAPSLRESEIQVPCFILPFPSPGPSNPMHPLGSLPLECLWNPSTSLHLHRSHLRPLPCLSPVIAPWGPRRSPHCLSLSPTALCIPVPSPPRSQSVLLSG